ncbi:MAG TPA: UPF0280 family protein [Clostridia bacterium]|nr:UPF0280 family protein [Clostridia bacterium]
MEQERFYRKQYISKDLVHFNVRVGETDLDIGARILLSKESMELIKECRRDIEGYIQEVPEFLDSLEPLAYKSDAPPIIKQMCLAGNIAGVGPMAAVAGAIAQYVGQGLLRFSREIIVENGGDIYIKSDKERIIGVYAGNSPLSNRIGIKVYPEVCPMGICTSSGKVGHSLSFGHADAVIAISHDATLADAVATAIGNRVKSIDDIQAVIDSSQNIKGINGLMIIMEDKLGVWGDIELVKL